MLRNLYSLVLCLLLSVSAFSQSTSGTLKGTVTDATTGEALPFATVVVLEGTNQVGATATDFDGKFTIKPIPVGSYNVRCDFVGYNPKVVSGVVISGGKINFQNFKMASGVNLDEVVITRYKKPLIEKDGGSSGGSVSREDISKMSARSATSVATTVGGVSSAGTAEGEVSVRGARSSDTFIYIDGIKVRGSANIPKAAIQEVSVITGGLPANIGDAVGGVISITTRGAQSKYFGGIDIVSSGFRSGDKNVGLDAYGRTQLEGYVAGPILFKKDSLGNNTTPLLGFFVSGNVRKYEDARPSAIGHWYIKDEALADLEQNPNVIEVIEGDDGASYSSTSRAVDLTRDSFENRKASRNADETGASLSAKLDFNVSPEVTFSLGASGDYLNTNEFLFRGYNSTNGFPGGRGRTNSVLNYKNNESNKALSWRTFARFTQRFKSDESADNKAVVKNAFYSISADYSKQSTTIEDRNHQADFFKYGHVGTFDITEAPSFNINGNTAIQDGFQSVNVDFTPSDFNPVLSNITNQFFTEIDDPMAHQSLEQVTASGVLKNGDAPATIYSLYSPAGLPNNLYRIRDNSQVRLTASGSADVGDHAVTLGVEYEQRVDRGYDLAPVGLWGRGRQLLQGQTQVKDELIQSEAPVNGLWQYTWDLEAIDNPTLFNVNFRETFGLNSTEQVNIDGVSPEELSIDMFSAEDLLANGSNLVRYYGYDHAGNKLTSDPSFDDYFNGEDDKGYKTKLVGAFRPIYNSFYVMDKFTFDDIIFNVGVRVDRYDANQKVLKDDYVVGDFYTVGNSPLESFEAPSNIDEDFVLYVSDYTASTNDIDVVGYRDGDDWYDADGVLLNGASTISGSTLFGPYLTPQTVELNTPQLLDAEGFEDYNPAINVMPRLAFSFPISDEAVFFAHYDVLTQRPGAGQNRLDLIAFDFIETRSNVATNNPNLRPSKTIDYELGFQQVLSKSSSLKISGFYRDMRDNINIRFLPNAWPNSYLIYRNVDFGTVKGMTFSYDLRRTGNVRLLANYTLQFASSTGSNATSGLTLARNGQPNLRAINPVNFDRRHAINITLDYRYGSGKDYNGPVWFGKRVFENMGANLIADIGSGTPYNATKDPNNILEATRGLKGTVNGSRQPGTAQLNLQIDRDIMLKFGKDDGGDKVKTSNMNVYLLINNLLNSKLVRNVYNYTGAPDNDGYLSSGAGQQQISSSVNPDAYVDYYNMRLANPYNYLTARTVQLGIRLDF